MDTEIENTKHIYIYTGRERDRHKDTQEYSLIKGIDRDQNKQRHPNKNWLSTVEKAHIQEEYRKWHIIRCIYTVL